MITIPTTELIGCIGDVLPIASDNKESETWGIKIAWDGESLRFSAYDVLIGGEVTWTPYEGAERDFESATGELPQWGGDDSPWQTFIHAGHAKEVLKLFKLPAKQAFTPVTVKCSPTGDRLIVERIDSPRGDRLLTIPGAPEVALRKIPNPRDMIGLDVQPIGEPLFSNALLGAFGAVRSHGVMQLRFGTADNPVAVFIGNRFAGFVYQAGARVHRYSFLRDAAGVAVS